MRARATGAYTFAEAVAVNAPLLTQIARVTLGAHIDDGQSSSRSSHRRQQVSSRMTPTPGSLSARGTTETLSTNTFERRAAASAAGRLAFVTQRLHPDLAAGCVVAVQGCGGS